VFSIVSFGSKAHAFAWPGTRCLSITENFYFASRVLPKATYVMRTFAWRTVSELSPDPKKCRGFITFSTVAHRLCNGCSARRLPCLPAMASRACIGTLARSRRGQAGRDGRAPYAHDPSTCPPPLRRHALHAGGGQESGSGPVEGPRTPSRSRICRAAALQRGDTDLC
jgi:hypothetical protein